VASSAAGSGSSRCRETPWHANQPATIAAHAIAFSRGCHVVGRRGWLQPRVNRGDDVCDGRLKGWPLLQPDHNDGNGPAGQVLLVSNVLVGG
jgi:hypothetical protein